MKKKALLLSLTALLTASAFAGVAIFSRRGFNPLNLKAEDENTTISFTSAELMNGVVKGQTEYDYTSGNTTLKTDQLKNNVTFHHEDTRCYQFNDTYYLDFKGTTGSVYNVTEIRSMVSLRVQMMGSFTMEWGWEVDGSGDPIYERSESMSGSNFDVECFFNYEYPNYFKLTIDSGTARQTANFIITMKAGCQHTESPIARKDGLLFKTYDTGYECLGFDGSPFANVVIPDQVNDLDVICIGEKAFENQTAITSVTLPSRLKIIDDGAFDHCRNIGSLFIPKTVTNINFVSCRDLVNCTSLTFEAGGNELLALGQGCFNAIGHQGKLILPSRICFFGNDIFESTYHITEFALNDDNVEDNIAFIEDGVLFSTTNTKKVLEKFPSADTRTVYTIPSDVNEIRSGSGLGDADNLVTLNVAPADGVSLFFDSYSAVSMDNLEHLNLGGEGTITFYWYCLRYAQKLKDIVVPTNVIVFEAGFGQIANDSADPLHLHLVASAIPASWDAAWDYNYEVDAGKIVIDYNYVA